MPVISASTNHPSRPYVLVQASWADVPSVTQAAVYRVNTVTGECVPLRPYVCYDGWELVLSGGHGTWWDTEAPFDVPFYYLTTSTLAPCLPATPLAYDLFGRTVVDGWSTATSGQPWVLNGGTNPGNYDVVPGSGTHTLDSTNVIRYSTLDIGQTDFDLLVDVASPVTAATTPITTRAVGRFADPSNTYLGGLVFGIGGTVTVQIAKIDGGVGTLLGQTAGDAYIPGVPWRIQFQGAGTTLRAKAWQVGNPVPTSWAVSLTDTSTLSGTQAGVSSRRDAGNTNGTVVIPWSNFEVSQACVPCAPVTADTSDSPVTLVSDGRFWLSDPVRPCNDRPVPLCPTDVPAPPCSGSGILFVGMGPEIYGANSFTMRPMNRRRNISATRPRGDATTALRLQTLTFADRDDLLELTAPGTLLQWRGPAEYGIADRYMNVADVQVSPELPDLRIQIRTEVLPYDVQDRPAGPSQGICGARVADICAAYPTWGDLAATGMTWDDLVAGQASPESANPDQRTWDDVNGEFADWNAVNAGGRTWAGLLAGD